MGKTTTKDRLLGKYENINSGRGTRSGSTGFETPVEVPLNSTPIFDRSATVIGGGRSNSWKACNVREQATVLLNAIEAKENSSDSEDSEAVFTMGDVSSSHFA